jgi:hypothetical protein
MDRHAIRANSGVVARDVSDRVSARLSPSSMLPPNRFFVGVATLHALVV